jgi:UDP:flavonoid glycosyltransferase YjiC (YdhE family)
MSGQLLPAMKAVAADEKVRQQCKKLADGFAQLGGPVKAAALLADLAG